MSDFVKSAIDILSRTQKEDEQGFVGEIIEINGLKFKVKKFLAAGGFSNVYAVSNKKGEFFAVKRLSGFDKEGCDKILKEVDVHKKLSNDNIVKLHGVSLIQKKVGSLKVAEYLLLTELCPFSLVDIVNEELQLFTILNIMNHAISAINYLHGLQPPIIHRDIKLENYLISVDGILKLCDFGSATTDAIKPNENWSMKKREEIQEEIFSNTSPMYRAPEIVSTWENYEISLKVDIWAIGCVFYCILYKKHPFEDAAKLRIINGNYVIPNMTKYNCFHTLIKKCLIVNPKFRIGSCEAVNILQHISRVNGHKVSEKINLAEVMSQNIESTICTNERSIKGRSFETESNILDNSDSLQSLINANAFLTSIKGGANLIFKNFLGSSSKVLNSVYNNKASNIFSITSRIIVSYESSQDILKKHLESIYLLSNISVYAFCFNNFRLPPPVRTIQISSLNYNWKIKTLDLEFLYNLVEEIFGFLNSEKKHILVLQESKCCNIIVVVVCALFLYSGLVEYIEDALQIFAVRVQPIKIFASEFRYLNYFKQILKESIPHHKNFNFVSLTLEKFNYKLEGGTLFVEIYENNNFVHSCNIMNLSNNAGIMINKKLIGNILILFANQKNSVKCLENNIKNKFASVQFHTGFLTNHKLLKFSKEDIDFDNDDTDLSILIKYTLDEETVSISKCWENVRLKKDPINLFSSQYEHNEVIENFVVNKKCSKQLEESENASISNNYDSEFRERHSHNIKDFENFGSIKEASCSGDSTDVPVLLDFTANCPEGFVDTHSITSIVPQELADIFGPSFENTFENLSINPTQTQKKEKDPFGDLLEFSFSDNGEKNSISKQEQIDPAVKKNVDQKHKKTEKLEKSFGNFSKNSISSSSSCQKNSQQDSDCFADLLGQQGYSFAKKMTSEPKTINDLRKKDVLNNLDEESLKIYKWTQGKRANIRALLCSMHTILWKNAAWSKCEMHQLVTFLEVKKAYRKACLAVHPDKHIGTENEKLSKLIFMELNSAWNNFNTENS
ncbi:cyclin-G-associated kinase [Condylostylus longicornis]|uniref:cyclin-G-associated kinase n=1 Tax=Condylostylus longicornis TaxID=2530218 RepID=UPI00244E5396|nr:cyclin-G-associated kinase [Condylostylus longicornis]